jgi:hypothetical protein
VARLSKGEVRDVDGQTGSVSSATYSLKSLSIDGRAIRHIVADSLPIFGFKSKGTVSRIGLSAVRRP